MDHLPDHPICERCTFPLAPPDRGRCPECGHFGRLDTRGGRTARSRLMGLLIFATSLLLAFALNALITEYAQAAPPTAGPASPAPPAAAPGPAPAPALALNARFAPPVIAAVGTLAAIALVAFPARVARLPAWTRKAVLLACITPYYAAGVALIAWLLLLADDNPTP